MGRFLNFQKSNPTTASSVPERMHPAVAAPRNPVFATPPPVNSFAAQNPGPQIGSGDLMANSIQSLGVAALIGYHISLFLGEVMSRHGIHPIASGILALLVPLWLLSGTASRALSTPAARFYCGFLFFMMLAMPFSVWRSSSLSLLMNYIPKSFLLLFFIPALMVSFKRIRTFFYMQAVCGFLMIMLCYAYGEVNGDRFNIGNSTYFGNSNEIALTLTIYVCFFLYLFYSQVRLTSLISIAGIILCFVYILKTGSRGGFLGLTILFLLQLAFVRSRFFLFSLGALLSVIAILIVPAETRHRLTYIVFKLDESNLPQTTSEIATLNSQLQRQTVIREAIAMTLKHPLFGVGPGQFAVAAFNKAKAENRWSPWVGTHNSYLEVSSECGIPALICYAAFLFLCMKMNYRVVRATSGLPEHREMFGMAASLLTSTIVYAISISFFHIAYNPMLPTLGGITIALYLNAYPVLRQAAARQMIRPI